MRKKKKKTQLTKSEEILYEWKVYSKEFKKRKDFVIKMIKNIFCTKKKDGKERESVCVAFKISERNDTNFMHDRQLQWGIPNDDEEQK